ncbi:BRO1 domain-containing protein BROX-like protein [Senna tora]|uniref:BRO1 domain-containing protein BROX-like protein n=1 Tax=Senna tora TaxID=362788 RepID=A0A834WE65_9FABA|nr:BRO1 domain-containing protein BROX-like protein [Senna tora]
MGCTYSVHALGKKKKKSIPEVVVFVPSIRFPVQSDLHRSLKGIVPREIADKFSSLRNQIVLVAEDTGGSAIVELRRALNEYLSVLIGFTKKEYNLEGLIEFKWKIFQEGRQDSCVANAWFEVLSAVHLMAMLTLSEADSLLIPQDHSGSGIRVVSSDNKREAVDLLLKASGYLQFCVREVLTRIPPEIKYIICQKATLSVKRRLACEQLIYFSQAYQCLLGCGFNQGHGKKHLRFIKWKFLEAKAAAYYYHGLILDKDSEPASHIGAVSCFLAAEEILAESRKACLSFCIAAPVTRAAPLWGAMKILYQKIPEVASRKSQMYGYLLEQEK